MRLTPELAFPNPPLRAARKPWVPDFQTAVRILLLVRVASAMYANIQDCDEGWLAFIQISKVLTQPHSLQLLGASALLAIWSWISDMGSNPHICNTKLGLYLVPHAGCSIVLCICPWKSNVGKFQVRPGTNKPLFSDQLSLLCEYFLPSCPRSVRSDFSALLSKRSTTELVVICSSCCYSMQACGMLQLVFIILITSASLSKRHSFSPFLFCHVCYHTCLCVCTGAFHRQEFD